MIAVNHSQSALIVHAVDAPSYIEVQCAIANSVSSSSPSNTGKPAGVKDKGSNTDDI